MLASTVFGSSVDNAGLAAMVADIVNDAVAASSFETSWPKVWTIGHSTRSAAELNTILATHKIGHLADVMVQVEQRLIDLLHEVAVTAGDSAEAG